MTVHAGAGTLESRAKNKIVFICFATARVVQSLWPIIRVRSEHRSTVQQPQKMQDLKMWGLNPFKAPSPAPWLQCNVRCCKTHLGVQKFRSTEPYTDTCCVVTWQFGRGRFSLLFLLPVGRSTNMQPTGVTANCRCRPCWPECTYDDTVLCYDTEVAQSGLQLVQRSKFKAAITGNKYSSQLQTSH